MKQSIRPPAVAGLFYPEAPAALSSSVHYHLNHALPHSYQDKLPKAIIAPHAGYVYSGPIAGTVYNGLEKLRGIISRVLLFGPSHRVPFHGIAVSTADYFMTPLGEVALDTSLIQQLVTKRLVIRLDQAHANEHSLEVQLPFLQETLHEFALVPFVVGEASSADVCQILESVWGGPETLVIISSDLSHYQSYEQCQNMDRATTHAIEHLQPEKISDEQACGRTPIKGLLELARKKNYTLKALDVRNSGDTAGPKDKVVGYGVYWLHA